MFGGVRGAASMTRHRGWIRGSDGGRGAAAPLAAAALWLVGRGWTTHNKHHKGKQSAYELYAATHTEQI